MVKNKDILWIFLHVPKTGGSTYSDQIKKYFKEEEFVDTSHVRYGFSKSIDKKNLNKIKVIIGHASYYGIHKLFPNKMERYIIFLRDPVDRLVSSYNFEMRTKTGKNLDFWKWYKLQPKNELIHFMDMKFRGKEGTKINVPGRLLKIFHNAFFSKTVTYFFQNLFKKYFDIFNSNRRMRKKFENSKKLLDRIYYIGFIPGLDKDLKFLFKEMGIPTKWEDTNVTPKRKIFFKLDENSRKKIYKDNKYDKEIFDYALKIKNQERIK